MAHVLGLQRTLVLAWGSFAVAIVIAVALGFRLEYDWPLFMLGAVPAAALLAIAVATYAWKRSQDALQLGFGLTGIATAALACGWLAAI